MVYAPLEFDLQLVVQKSDDYDNGTINSETQLCKLLMLAYHKGFDDGVEDTEAMQLNTHILMFHTGGHC